MERRNEFADHVVDLLRPLGHALAKRMFGGVGIYIDGGMLAIVVDDSLWLKTDDENRGAFEAAKLPPFTYARQGKTVSLSFHRAPDEALESPALLQTWARGAHAAAQRAAARKKPRLPKGRARRSQTMR